MLSKLGARAGTFFCSLALALGASGCSNLFGQKPDEKKPLEIKMNACMKDLKANLGLWFQDGQGDIGASIDCAAGAINEFSHRVQGQTKEVYTRAELSSFISDILTAESSPNAGSTADLTAEILHVKQIILGGSDSLVTKDELARLRSLLLRARPFMVQLSPNLKTLLFRAESADVKQVASAKDSLAAILDLVATEFERNDVGRPEAGFRDLLKSANKLGMKNTDVASWIPLAESVKVLVLGGEPDQLRSREWAPMIRAISKTWGLALVAKYTLASNNQVLGSDFGTLQASVKDVMSLLTTAVASHDGAIPNANFEQLVDLLAAKEMLPRVKGFPVGAETIKDLLPVVFGKLLYGRSKPSYQRLGLRFGQEQLETLNQVVNDWLAGQVLINRALKGHSDLSVSEFGTALTTVQFARGDFIDAGVAAQAASAQKQLLLFMAKGRPPVLDARGRIVVVTRKDLPRLKSTDLNLLNATRVIIGSVLSGWAEDKTAADTMAGLLDKEVQDVYLDFRELGHDLNFMDIRSNQAGIRTFMETAVFMSSSDGNDRMGLQEGVEWLNYVLSGGAIADSFYAKIASYVARDGKVCAVPKTDVLGNPKVRASCFREAFAKYYEEFIPNLPRMISWIRADGSGKRLQGLIAGLEAAGRSRGLTDNDVDSSEMRSMIPIAQYVESMFARHDANQNEVLDDKEIWGAFPLLSPFVKKMGNGSADSVDVQKTILSWILTFGSVPDTSTVGIAKLAGWYLIHGWFSEEADRLKILNVIGSFGQAAKITRVKNITSYYESTQTDLPALMRNREMNTARKMAELFQCLPEAAPMLARDFAADAANLVPTQKPLSTSAFIWRVKQIIDADTALERSCLPF